MKPFFSIIIPTYNRADFISKTLQSVIDQSYENFEVVVVDDGSTDNTEQLMRDWTGEKVRYLKKINEERAAARNFGVAHARGDYVTFLDSDDLFYTDCLQNAHESILKFKSPPFLHLGYEVTDHDLKPKNNIDFLKSDDIGAFVKGNPLSCIGVFLREDIARRFRFNEDRDLSGSEDWELWIRIAANVGIKTDNRISAALVNHSSRSVQQYDKDKLVRRKELAVQYAFSDAEVSRKFSIHLPEIISSWNSYIALHLVMSRQYKDGLNFWYRSVERYPLSIFQRRTLAIFKLIIKGLPWKSESTGPRNSAF